MRLSGLQRFALLECYTRRSARLTSKSIHSFYSARPKPPGYVQDVVTKSLESLIDKGLLIGYGRRTPKMWFIDEIRLTPSGRRVARKLLGEQLALPLKSKQLKSRRTT